MGSTARGVCLKIFHLELLAAAPCHSIEVSLSSSHPSSIPQSRALRHFRARNRALGTHRVGPEVAADVRMFVALVPSHLVVYAAAMGGC